METRNRIIISIGAIVGLAIGLVGGSVDGFLSAILWAWVGLGIGGNILPLFSEVGCKFRYAFYVGKSRGEPFLKNLLSTLLFMCFVIAWRLIKDSIYGAVRYGIQMYLGDWERFKADE